MTTVVKSVNLTLLEAGTTWLPAQPGLEGQPLRIINDFITFDSDTASPNLGTAIADSAGSVLLGITLPSDAKIDAITVFNTALDTDSAAALAVNVGVANGPIAFVGTDSALTAFAADATIKADAYAAAITTLQAANTLGVNVAFQNRSVALTQQAVWQDAGLSSDPTVPLQLVLAVTTAAATAATSGTIAVHIRYATGQ
jgi:hypothetical protein